MTRTTRLPEGRKFSRAIGNDPRNLNVSRRKDVTRCDVTLDELLAAHASAAVEAAAATLARPSFVHQRSVEAVVGLPSRDYLRLGRAGAFATSKERRLVLARTEDVVAYVEAQRATAAPANDDAGDEDAALAMVGARRIGAAR